MKYFFHDCTEKLDQRRAYSVQLTFPPSGKPYLRDEILDSLAEVGVMPDDLSAVGPISDNSRWMVCLSNKETVVRLLPRTPSVRSNKARMFSMDKALNTVKVHWLPTYVPMANVIVFLSQFGVVQTTILGRGPVCFKCKHTGHTRANCSTPFCRHCSTYGHTSEDCASSKSYAASLSPAQPHQQEEVDMDEPEEADVNTGRTQDQQSKTGNTDMEAEKRVEDTINVIPETDYKTTQSSSTGKIDDSDDNATDNAAGQEIFGDITDIKDSEAGSDGSEGSDVSTSAVCEREADF